MSHVMTIVHVNPLTRRVRMIAIATTQRMMSRKQAAPTLAPTMVGTDCDAPAGGATGNEVAAKIDSC